jgi:hypothetical protein
MSQEEDSMAFTHQPDDPFDFNEQQATVGSVFNFQGSIYTKMFNNNDPYMGKGAVKESPFEQPKKVAICITINIFVPKDVNKITQGMNFSEYFDEDPESFRRLQFNVKSFPL